MLPAELLGKPDVKLDLEVPFTGGGFRQRHAFTHQHLDVFGVDNLRHLHVDGFPVQGGDKDAGTEQRLVKIDGDGFDEVVAVTLKLGVFLLVDDKDDICGDRPGSLNVEPPTTLPK